PPLHPFPTRRSSDLARTFSMNLNSSIRNSVRLSYSSLKRSNGRAFTLSATLMVLIASPPGIRADSGPQHLESYGGPPSIPAKRGYSPRTVVSLPSGTSFQANVSGSGQNIAGDAANEPSLCIDPTNPNRIAIGWRQFDSTNDPGAFRQSGVAYSTNGGLNWTFPGVLEPGTFRSDPVLASDANGVFYFLGISNSATFAEDLFRSTNGGATWQRVGGALGGDKEWVAIDTTTGPGRGNIYQDWSPFANIYNDSNRLITRSNDAS